MSKKNDLVDVDAILVHETENALLVDIGEPENVWLPKSSCIYYQEQEIVTVPERLAIEKGMV